MINEFRTYQQHTSNYTFQLAPDGKRPEKPGKKKQQEKKKSNLEIFKEELKAIQEEREERHRIKGMLRTTLTPGSGPAGESFSRSKEDRGSMNSSSSALLADASSKKCIFEEFSFKLKTYLA